MTEIISTPKRGRKLAAMIAGALALGVLPLAMPASAQTTPLPMTPRDIGENACPVDDKGTPATSDDTTEVPDEPFTDVADGDTHAFSIACVVWYEVASGTSATTYNPGGDVRREQMATFIAQLIDYAADPNNAGTAATPGTTPPVPQALPAADTGNQFPCDVNTGSTHFNNIQRLAKANIVKGTGTTTAGACFEPGAPVSRSQMATFIKAAQDYIRDAVQAPIAEDYFVDDEGDTHENNINIIAKEGIVRGTGTNSNNEALYNPGGNVKRDQMASFLANKLDVLVEDDLIEPPPAVDTITITPVVRVNSTDIDVAVMLKRGNVDSIQVSGCGITGTDLNAQPFASTNPATAVGLGLGATTGNCELTIVIETDEDTTLTETRTITVT